MTLTSLQALTWSTVTGAVVSALLLASGESALLDLSPVRRAATPSSTSPPAAPAAAQAPNGVPPADRRIAKRGSDGR